MMYFAFFFNITGVINFIFCVPSGGNEGSIPIWMLHSASAMFGIVVLHTLFGLALLYLVVCCVLSYLLLVALASRGRYLSGVVVAVLIVIYVVFW